ncbi:MAG: peptidoglycan DD-metalloendopeptidase family protein [Bacteroidota bacterium]
MRLSPQSKFYLFIFFILALLTLYAALGGRDIIGDGRVFLQRLFGPSTPRTAYRKQLKKNAQIGERDLEIWDLAYDVAKSSQLRVALPHRELIYIDNNLIHSAQALRLQVPAGRRLRVRVLDESPHLFGELFRVDRAPAGKRPLAYWQEGEREFTYEPRDLSGEDLLLLLQAAPWQYSRFEVQLTTEPVLLFPVANKDEKAIQSFWGAPRDGGARKHEGNDIFAPKGTKLLALTDGMITRVSNGGLGGKTVWLYDRERDLRYYYAHLDEQLVNKGQRVWRGDVVGTVGNTGNARTTPPHLHFGIYANAAIDPYPFLQRPDALPASPSYSLREAAASLSVPRSGNHYLRISPERDGTVIRQLRNGEAVTGLGATGRFYRVQTAAGELGYVNFD